MAKKSKKRVSRKSARKSWWSKFFTFPVIAVFAFAALSTFTLYQVTKPSGQVAGVSTANYDTLTDSQYERLKNVNIAVKYPRYLYTRLWIDSDGDGRRDSGEKCPNKNYKFIYNGKQKTVTQSSNCKIAYLDLKQECSRVVFNSKYDNFTFTGIEYIGKNGSKYALKPKGKKYIDFCGGETIEFGWAREVSFGIKPK